MLFISLLNITFDDSPNGFLVFDLRVNDQAGLSVPWTHQTPMAANGERFGVWDTLRFILLNLN